MTWVLLEKANDWGQEYFALPGKALGGFFQTASARRGIPFEAGMKIRTRWPDGSERELPVVFREFHERISDMGHEYSMTNRVAGFEADLFGVPSWVKANVPQVWLEDLPAVQPEPEPESDLCSDRKVCECHGRFTMAYPWERREHGVCICGHVLANHPRET